MSAETMPEWRRRALDTHYNAAWWYATAMRDAGRRVVDPDRFASAYRASIEAFNRGGVTFLASVQDSYASAEREGQS